MLSDAELVAFVPSTDLDRSLAFYTETLGLRLVEQTPVALVLDAHGRTLRVAAVDERPPAQHTVVGWVVADVAATVAWLRGQGVALDVFDGMDQDADGVWTAPGGDRIAWFTDPDGNRLSVTQPASGVGPVCEQVSIVVRDMNAAVSFYRRLGVTIPDQDPTWDAHHRAAEQRRAIDFDLDSEAFVHEWDEGWPGGGAGRVVVGFRLASRDDVDRVYADLTGAGHPGQQPPYDAFWGARYAIVEDPDGNPIGLMSPADPALRRRPPDPPSP